ncbi:MAG TPA: ThuA domain-containing protein [Planctomycetota bacterium]|nr:ThuA domain-containing protein [Planctomycetota bacterium]
MRERRVSRSSWLLVPFLAFTVLGAALRAEEPLWVVYEGEEGPGKGKHIVFVTGDEEYRSEEGMPQLAKILAKRHGFRCTVLFAIDPKTGEIDPNQSSHIPGLEALRDADLMVIFTRFRELPDEDMKHIDDFVHSGKPIIGLRTATHAFHYRKSKDSKYAHYDWQSREWAQGFGRQVLGETWINHHGHHGGESTRGVIPEGKKDHPIVRGCEDIWGPTDVYGVRLPLPEGCEPVVLGQVVAGMKPTDPPVEGKKNDPMMPIAWTKTFKGRSGKEARVFATTMGASQDLESEGLRRLLVNAAYWALGMEEKIPERADVRIVGKYEPTPFGFNAFKKGVKPADHKL